MPEADEGNESDGSGVDWTVRLREVERLEPDEAEAGEEIFSVEFELSGLGVSGSLTALVTDPDDETTVVVEALDQLRNALVIYARVVGQREDVGLAGGDLATVTDEREATSGPSLSARIAAVELLLREVLGFSLARVGIVDRARLATDALEREATLSGDGQRREHASEVRTAVERLTE